MKQLKLIAAFVGLFLMSVVSLNAAKTIFAPIKTAKDLQPATGECNVVFVQKYSSTTWYSPYYYTTNSNTGVRVISMRNTTYCSADYSRLELDLTNAQAKEMVWTIYPSKTGKTMVRSLYNTDQWWANSGATQSYLGCYSQASYPGYIREYQLPTSAAGGQIYATNVDDYTLNASYKYLYYYNTNYFGNGASTVSYSTFNIYRQANEVTFNAGEWTKYATINTATQYVFDSLTLPAVSFLSSDYSAYINIDGWYNGSTKVGNPGDKVKITANTALTLKCTKTGTTDLTLGFSINATQTVYLSFVSTPTKDNMTLYSLDGTITLPTLKYDDARYAGYVKNIVWRNSAGTTVGKPGDKINVTTNDTYTIAYSRTKFTVTLDPGFFGTCGATTVKVDSTYTLPSITFNKTEYSNRVTFNGWYYSTGTKAGNAAAKINIYCDTVLTAKYSAIDGAGVSYFKRVKKQADLQNGGKAMKIIIINNNNYAVTAYSTKNYTSTTYIPNQNTFYTTSGSSTTTAWSTKRTLDEFSIDLTEKNNSYDNNRFVWTITKDSNTLVYGYSGYWGSYNLSSGFYSSYPYLYTVPSSNTTTQSSYPKQYFNFIVNGTTGDNTKIEWTKWSNASYRMLYYNGTSYSYFGSATVSNSTYTVFRKAYQVYFDVDAELADYGTCTKKLYTLDNITLPSFNFSKPEYATYISNMVWLDENGNAVGKPGDVITVTRNMDLHLSYTIKKFKVTFDAGDYGTCSTTEVMALLPFTLPNVAVQSGYYFEGWASTINDRIVGRGGETYPKSASILSYDDDLYAVYTQSFDVLEWGENSLTLEFLNAAATAETQTSNGTKKINNLTDCEVDKGIYRLLVNNGDLANDFGQTLTIVFKDAQGVVVSQATTIIPAIVTSSVKIEDEYDRMLAATTDLIVTNGGVATAGTTNFSFQNIKVQGGGKLVIPAGASLTAGKVSLCVGAIENGAYQFVYPQLVANGSLTNANGDTIVVEYLLNEDQYYTLCLPYNVKVSEVTYPTGSKVVLNKNLWVAVYDGAKRATSVKGSLTSGWVDFSGTQFTAGTGYTIAATPRTVRITGGSTVQRKYALINMPMKANLTSGETTSNKTTPVSPYPTSTGGDNDAGWNLVGDPYLADYGGNVDGLVNNNGIGLLVDDGAGGYDWQGKVRYVVMPNNNGTAYNPVVATATSLPAFKNFFVQIGTGDALTFLLSNRAQKKPAYFAQFEEDEYAEDIMTGIKVTHGDMVDKVGVVIGDNYTTDYEINGDLQKWTNYLDTKRTVEALNLYAIGADDQLAFIALNENDAKSVKLGIHMPESGGYTFSIDDTFDTSNLEAVNLTYTAKGKAPVTTNLLEGTYRINAGAATTYTDRLTLSVVKKQNTPTGIDALETNADNVDKVIVDGALYIINNGKVYDAQGVLVK